MARLLSCVEDLQLDIDEFDQLPYDDNDMMCVVRTVGVFITPSKGLQKLLVIPDFADLPYTLAPYNPSFHECAMFSSRKEGL